LIIRCLGDNLLPAIAQNFRIIGGGLNRVCEGVPN
jgi:hypothetical protein